MSNTYKRVAVVALSLLVGVTSVFSGPVTNGQTIDELLQQLAALQAQLAALQAQQGGSSVCASVTYTRNLTLGSTGDDVKALQCFLNTHGAQIASTGAGSPGNETTYFGSLTRTALAKYQAANAISPAVGYFGPITRSHIAAMAVVTPPPTTTPPTTVVTGAVSVSLASDSPTGTLIIDNTTGVMQNAAPVAKYVFSNGSSAATTVTTLRLNRTGISADADVNNLYLYEGTTKLAEMGSVSSKVFTFSNSTGLFTIPANSSKTIWVGVNMAPATSGPTTIGFSINSAADIVGGTFTGTFPVMGNEFRTAFITDLGHINLTNTTTFPATMDPSSTAQELWRFTTTAESQKMQLKRVVLTMVGTISTDAITDLTLSVGGVQIGPTAQIGSDNLVVFDFGSTPYEIASGQNRVIVLSGKVVKGTGRAFKFTVRSTADFVSRDTNYGVDTTPLLAGAALTVVDPDSSGDGTNINNGTLTISRSSNSPSGNIASGASDIALARFDYKAAGEDIKVVNVRVSVDRESTDETLDDGKLYFNGSQVGTTDDSVADETDNVFALGNSAIIPAGTTGVFEYRANIQTAAGVDTAADQTIVVSLSAGTAGDAVGQTSLTNLTPSASTGQTLTVKTGTLSAAKNTSVADSTTVTPTGVVGATNVRIGSFVLTAGAGEAVNLTQIVIGDDNDEATSDLGDNLQNLTLKNSSGTAISPTQGTLSGTAGADFTFTMTPSVTIAAGAQYVVDVYADILTGAAGFLVNDEPGVEFVSAAATGVNTSADASVAATDIDLHDVVIAASGSLTITANSSTPVAGQIVMGETDVTLAMLDFAAGSSEDMNVSVITITDTSSFAGSLQNIKLYDGTTLLGTIATFGAQTNGTATFNLASNWAIPKNTTRTLTIKATVNAYGSAVSGGAHTLNLASNANVTTEGAQSGVAITETVTAATGTAQDVYRSRVTVAKGASSPSGTATAGAAATVLEFTVAADSRYEAVLNTVAITLAGSVDTTSTGNANLYKSTDLVTALATETYNTVTGDDSGAGDAHSTTEMVIANGDADGIPVGANVRITNASNGDAYFSGTFEVTLLTDNAGTDETVTFTPAASEAIADGDIMYYRPLQPGTGKLYFGSQSALGADLADTGTDITVVSTDGFSLGDTVTVTGFSAAGVATTSTAGGVITSIPDATSLIVSAVTLAATIDYDYLSTAGNAITNNHNSLATAYTGRPAQTVAAGSTMTFVVKGDTTGATVNETLRADIAAVGDLNWDDTVNFGIITDTKVIPVTGGTLSY